MAQEVLADFSRVGMSRAVMAVNYMVQVHADARNFRDDGQPYAVHPLMMLRHAWALNSPFIDETAYVVIATHDIPEETGKAVEELPISAEAQEGVRFMTVSTHLSGLARCESTVELALMNRRAAICRALDTYANLTTMAGVFGDERVRKKIVEVDQFRLPAIKRAMRKWPAMKSLLQVLYDEIQCLNDNLALWYEVKLKDADFKNPTTARDYNYLIRGEEK